MQRLLPLLTAALFLTGCGMYTMEEEPENETEESNIQAAEEQGNADIEFTLQESDKQAQVSPLNDESLKVLSDRVYAEEMDSVGEEGEVTVDYSGAYLTFEDSLYGVFLITNRTNSQMADISTTISMTHNDESLLENYPVHLAEEHFGILESDSAMPLYIEFDTNQGSQLNEANNLENIEVNLSEFSFAEAGKREKEPMEVNENSNPGYHPSYTNAILSQQELYQNIETGNVPPLELLNPPVFQDQIGQEIIEGLTEETLNMARGLSVENEINLFWTGVTQQLSKTGEYRTVFLLTNRTANTYSNINMGLSFGEPGGQTFLNEHTMELTEEDYGQFTDETLMPIYVTIPPENTDGFSEYLQNETGSQPYYEITSFDGEEE